MPARRSADARPSLAQPLFDGRPSRLDPVVGAVHDLDVAAPAVRPIVPAVALGPARNKDNGLPSLGDITGELALTDARHL